MFNRFGPAETTIVVTHQHLTDEVLAAGTVPIGLPHPASSFYLVDRDGDIIEELRRAGELYIGTAQLMEGYWGDQALTSEVLRADVVPNEVVYRTGDLVFRDESGNFVYVDRADRVINRNGLRTSRIELSEAIRNVAGVSAAACVAFDDDGELGIVAFVVADREMSEHELRLAARGRIPEAMLPNRFELIETLPVNRSNKLDERTMLSGVGLRGPLPPKLPRDVLPST